MKAIILIHKGILGNALNYVIYVIKVVDAYRNYKYKNIRNNVRKTNNVYLIK